MNTDESVARAMAATEAEHSAAISTVRCVICGAEPGAECVYGVLSGRRESFPGRAHTRRVRAYLDGLDARDPDDEPTKVERTPTIAEAAAEAHGRLRDR